MPLKQTTLTHLWPAAASRDDAGVSSSTRSQSSGLVCAPSLHAAGPVSLTASTDGPPASLTEQHVQEPAEGAKHGSNTEESSTRSGEKRISNVHLPANTTLEPLTQSNLLAFRRLIKTLLPVRYPDKTYAGILANELGNQIARVLVWHDPNARAAACSAEASRGIVVGAICARVQPVANAVCTANAPHTETNEVYVQMLGVLAPYRSQGLASALLRDVMQVAATQHGVRQVMAHVWEAHEDALQWYTRRGFAVDHQMIENYYQQLRPRGAWLVRRRIGVLDLVCGDGHDETNKENV